MDRGGVVDGALGVAMHTGSVGWRWHGRMLAAYASPQEDAMEDNGSVGTVTIVLVDARGERSTETCPLDEFEHVEHGAIIGRRTIPWHRIERVWWQLPPREPDGEAPGARVRVLVEDGSSSGEEIVVASDRFEVMSWAVGLLVDDRADTSFGTIHQRRIVVPWHAVLEWERLVSLDDARELVPGRPAGLR
jgi:hypothetical protein